MALLVKLAMGGTRVSSTAREETTRDEDDDWVPGKDEEGHGEGSDSDDANGDGLYTKCTPNSSTRLKRKPDPEARQQQQPPKRLKAEDYIAFDPPTRSAAPPDAREVAAYQKKLAGLTGPAHPTTDSVRVTVRKRLGEALSKTSCGSGHFPSAVVAAEIEHVLFEQNSSSTKNDAYKNAFRKLEFNLKDAKNSALRSNILTGSITALQLVKMTPQQLANPSLKAEHARADALKTAEKLREEPRASTTDVFQCGKCKGRRCAYTQVQIRRADEPMTTFVNCMICGNRWRC
eukprot:NODE_4272_length_1089_cov_18.699793_g4073_i0.p1 GENE.NODE_4272_length_1089_cov_18.699793_g4073_i0~~NODE_4272_length_1089_cov_18.699793_g4073_i0.p1  ORF type:complete len:289 (+),score=56.85 NODE_4272_length_1089_cov_18.699793_g4073_i0:104-970(+)